MRGGRVGAILKHAWFPPGMPGERAFLASAYAMYRRLELLMRIGLEERGSVLPSGEKLGDREEPTRVMRETAVSRSSARFRERGEQARSPTTLMAVKSPGWTGVILTIVLFMALELSIANIIEPWLYGSNARISPFFWSISTRKRMRRARWAWKSFRVAACTRR